MRSALSQNNDAITPFRSHLNQSGDDVTSYKHRETQETLEFQFVFFLCFCVFEYLTLTQPNPLHLWMRSHKSVFNTKPHVD